MCMDQASIKAEFMRGAEDFIPADSNLHYHWSRALAVMPTRSSFMNGIDDLAERLAGARQSRKFLTFGDELRCPTAVAAYRVQAQTVRILSEKVAGWKVGIGPDGNAMAAPILTGDLVGDGEAFKLSGDLASVKVEAELALRLGCDLPARVGEAYTRDDILGAVAEVFCGIELVHTRFRNDADVDFVTRLADNFAHGAYAIGGGTSAFGELDLAQLRCIVRRDGSLVSDRNGGHPLGDPLTPVLAWANGQCDELGGLRAGQFITTGTLIEPFAAERATELQASLDRVGAVSLRISTPE